ncbi:hypothetical protein Dshi_2285 [Dinoroseobacter shibae DFL 12 = DSM 16493]|uniref:Lipoprotein n=1 Tax=Dinoroseobacter shibae (strain DSM 16493 / NCIMB 14021 / DFL 12) TaxID=398580 RepID=A8LR98_DINSH|nr:MULTISPECIES: DUF3299 domain-containing protein [Dinoroseobacter]ABV94021.1 hypothetical protein Dshi_2285 [Dinoroseobacter shibae DFL 12 = DSM 16493]MDD9716465.1 DUF3299 domain-containing protein [Dinoroseobacter sp. PD6]URF45463.1 DUF3299 domain-containing protein [Dinoroseobacter shibae]URF49768.1 DUF3299 domain-containing protein [Dinoroseobacter shibae]
MFKSLSLVLGFVLNFAPAAAFAVEPREVTWADLAPPAAAIDNPFERLTPGQMDALRLILRHETRPTPTSAPEAALRVQELRDTLAKDGVDVDALFQARLDIIAHRQAAASRVNEGVLGAPVRMAGFVLPLSFEGERATEFLLVPTVGACIHTPPPAPNQVVHVVYPEGVEVTGLFTPVWINGALVAQSSRPTVRFSDGQAPVSVSYMMTADIVDYFSD